MPPSMNDSPVCRGGWCWRVSVLCICTLFNLTSISALLRVQDSETRETKCLDGLWNFRADFSPSRKLGFDEEWFKNSLSQTGPVLTMPVPSSFNDLTQNKTLRDYVGWVWYDRDFFAPNSWYEPRSNNRIVLRFESVHYYAKVWLNGNFVVEHEGGHLPFEEEVTDLLVYDRSNRVTVAVNNTLDTFTLPPGQIVYKTDYKKFTYPPGYFVQEYEFDFFNYAGINRPVNLYTTPSRVYIQNITINATFTQTSDQVVTGILEFSVSVGGNSQDVGSDIKLYDRENYPVAQAWDTLSNVLRVPNVFLWWPYTMSDTPGYLYTLQVEVAIWNSKDIYRIPVGFRHVNWSHNQFFINNKPFYFAGFGRHEDYELRGRSTDHVHLVKDFNLIQWIGANSFRTSHYPYSEDIMDMCDKLGIVVIDESPAVGVKLKENFNNITLQKHMRMMSELIDRDKNRPSVVMWSVANEPASHLDESLQYFNAVITHTKQLDSSRPVTFASNKRPDNDKVVPLVDIISVNSYFSWYEDTGEYELIYDQVVSFLTSWYTTFNKPVIQMEYGADTIAGYHMDPPWIFTEEYQVEVLRHHHIAFDDLKRRFLVGELVWNFADFMTKQTVNRVVGNKKGIFTRQRQPKAAAHFLRERYLNLANNSETNGY